MVFDKGRAPGGRASTRREGGIAFDHGAQYFTARDTAFRAQTDRWIRAGLVARWTGAVRVLEHGVVTAARRESNRIDAQPFVSKPVTSLRYASQRSALQHDAPQPTDTERFVGVPGMSALAKDLARGIDVRFSTRVDEIVRDDGRWMLRTEAATFGPFDALVVTAPASQTATLFAIVAPTLAAHASLARMRPCWAVMVDFADADAATIATDFDAAFVVDSPLAWIARDSSKPGRASGERWVLHATSVWSEAHVDIEPERATSELLGAFETALARAIPTPRFAKAHRWMFALPDPALAERSIGDDALALFAGGDWCGGPRIEGAFSSGLALAERVLARP